MKPPVGGVILAGGASRRMGSPKALLEIEGKTFLDRIVAAFQPQCRQVIVVLGFHGDRIRIVLNDREHILQVENPEPERGMLSSLQCGLAALNAETAGALFTPVDYPLIRPATVAALVREFEHSPDAPAIIPTHAGHRGHPVLIHRQLVEELLALPQTAQPRDVIRRHRPQTRHVAVDDPGILQDIDTPEDYAAIRPSG